MNYNIIISFEYMYRCIILITGSESFKFGQFLAANKLHMHNSIKIVQDNNCSIMNIYSSNLIPPAAVAKVSRENVSNFYQTLHECS